MKLTLKELKILILKEASIVMKPITVSGRLLEFFKEQQYGMLNILKNYWFWQQHNKAIALIRKLDKFGKLSNISDKELERFLSHNSASVVLNWSQDKQK